MNLIKLYNELNDLDLKNDHFKKEFLNVIGRILLLEHKKKGNIKKRIKQIFCKHANCFPVTFYDENYYQITYLECSNCGLHFHFEHIRKDNEKDNS